MEWFFIENLMSGVAIGCVVSIFLFPFVVFYNQRETSRQDRKWKAWEKKHAWPLGEHAYIVTDRFIEAQKSLGREASPKVFQQYIARESGEEFPMELCQTLLTEVAMQPKLNRRGAIEKIAKAEPSRVGNEVAIGKMPKAKPSRVDNGVVIEKTAKAKSPTVGEEQPQIRVCKESPVITDVDKLTSFGQMALEQGWYDQARDHFEQALALDPSNREAMKGLARVYERLSHRGAGDD